MVCMHSSNRKIIWTFILHIKFSNFHNNRQSLHIMSKNYILEYRRKLLPFDKNLQAKNFERIKFYGDTGVTPQFKTHHQNLLVCLKWETKIILKQSKRRKTFKSFGNEILLPRNKDRKLMNATFYLSLLHLSRLVGKLTMWFFNRFDTNRPAQSQKRARRLKFRI